MRAPSPWGGRLYVHDLPTGALTPISPEGVTSYFNALASPDGSRAFAVGPDGRLALYPVAGGEGRAVPGTSVDDIPIRWTADGRAIFVLRRAALPGRVERVAYRRKLDRLYVVDGLR